MKTKFTLRLPSLDIFLVTSQKDVDSIAKLKGYVLPQMDNSIARCIHTESPDGYNVVIIYYPTLLTDEPIQAQLTLVHECCHAFDFIRDHFGYGYDTELHAYGVESIYASAFERYAKMRKKGNKNA